VRRLIVTADDFGAAVEVNEAVERAHRDGILSAASLMVAGVAAGDAVQIAPQHPDQVHPPIGQVGEIADPQQPISDVQTLTEIVESNTASRRVQARVLGAFAAIAFLLAAVGIHGLLSFSVSQRTQEIGVRMALGAKSGQILSLILGESSRLAIAGVVLGAGLGYGAGRAMQSLLAGLEPGDAATFATAMALAVMMTLAGSLIPTVRAVRVDPAVAVRAE